MQYLWRAVDQHGNVLDLLVQSRRDAGAAKRFFRTILKKQCRVPRVLVTDKLGSYGAALRVRSVEHRCSTYLNDRAGNSHQPPASANARHEGLPLRRRSPKVPVGVQCHLATLEVLPLIELALPEPDGQTLLRNRYAETVTAISKALRTSLDNVSRLQSWQAQYAFEAVVVALRAVRLIRFEALSTNTSRWADHRDMKGLVSGPNRDFHAGQHPGNRGTGMDRLSRNAIHNEAPQSGDGGHVLLPRC